MDRLNITNLGSGAALEIINEALSEVYQNINDPNTTAEAVRKIQFEIKFKPDDERCSAKVEYHVKTKLAPIKSVETKIAFFRREGKTFAREFYVDQLNLFEQKEEEENIIGINQEAL